MIVAMAGLPGTGKSTIARAVAGRLPDAVVLDKDRIRPALFTQHQVTYSHEQDDFCVTVMLDTAAFLLTANPERTVILDGRTHSRTYQVQHVRTLADRLQQPLAIIECICDEPIARCRLDADVVTGAHPAENRTYALYRRLKAAAEPITAPKLILDTTASDPTADATTCLTYLTDVRRLFRAGDTPTAGTRSESPTGRSPRVVGCLPWCAWISTAR